MRLAEFCRIASSPMTGARKLGRNFCKRDVGRPAHQEGGSGATGPGRAVSFWWPVRIYRRRSIVAPFNAPLAENFGLTRTFLAWTLPQLDGMRPFLSRFSQRAYQRAALNPTRGDLNL
jgi:hypothetical protein